MKYNTVKTRSHEQLVVRPTQCRPTNQPPNRSFERALIVAHVSSPTFEVLLTLVWQWLISKLISKPGRARGRSCSRVK